ncbi:protein kinase [Mycobacterium shinjukuense]|uniref:protein kinase domain-containing protein n=1 Tax=Mycobacterium shinjukuense TaxID=398694 RepID=UPI000A0E036D|nr:protein kinase [Mycobacterium shinjukuense]MCV6986830.1 protein kinase [Mycobacterium shinjukuense]ORB62449.1 hypothetical protein BST45_18910 [Mycobacterium shinjukuense]
MRSGVAAELYAAGFDDAVEIGRGGFGVVFSCTQVELDRMVAVKVLTTEADDNRLRFMREQKAMGRLTGHPNIVAVLQVGETDSGHLFLVMPYYRRGSLQQQISRLGVLALEDVLSVGVKLAGALESAHQLGIVHRDVKPANILITDYGEPALSDFGIARVTSAYTTATGVYSGTPAYSAPEVLGGAAPTAASDVYGLGATLFTTLTGHAAFERRADEQVMAHFLRIISEPVPDLREHGIAGEVAAVIDQAMAHDPSARPSARELGERLQLLQSQQGLVVDEMALQAGDGVKVPARRSVTGAALPRSVGNLPTVVSQVVGRGAELAELRTLVAASRLVTLTGPGGVGKTALAISAGAELGRSFPDGVWLAQLGELRDGSLLVEVVAMALGVHDRGGRPLTAVLADAMSERHALLVLDNCEHVVNEVAELVHALLRDCPRLHIVATSREVLNVAGEAVLVVPPLECPDAAEDPTLPTLAGYAGVELFVQRARATVAGFALTEHNATAVARICSRLDGLPLAIELAAARLRAMSADQIAEALSDRYTLLSRGHRGAPVRQQTLAGCVGWSYELCSRAEQELWGRLSVFAASFDLPAAHHICGPDVTAGEYLDQLSALVDKSILMRTEHQETARFRLLDTLRDYGAARIGPPEKAQLQRRHAHWYRQLVSDARAQWNGPHQIQWLHRLIQELPNIREALQYSVVDDWAAALEMTTALYPFWDARGMLSEGQRWTDLALSAARGSPQRAAHPGPR